MVSEWAGPLATGMTALAGIAATFFTAKYNSVNNLRIFEADRRHKDQQETINERKSTYARMLHAFEEFYFTLSILKKGGYGGRAMGSTGLTREIHKLLSRNLEIDLTIQNVERELELIAPLHVVKECRRAFYALREQTRTLTEDGNLSPEPYDTILAKVVCLMRLDLHGKGLPDASPESEAIEKSVKEIFALNAPPSAIQLNFGATEGITEALR